MTGEDVEVAADVLHVDGQMHGGLAAVEQHRNAMGVGDLHDLLHRHDGAERIRHVGDRYDLGARRDQLLELVEQEIAIIVDRRPFDDGALALAEKMPGHDVGMVLEE